MNQTCNNIAQDPVMEPDRDRVREVGRVRDRFRVMLREVEEMGESLKEAATFPAA
jgi:hypothetical protein